MHSLRHTLTRLFILTTALLCGAAVCIGMSSCGNDTPTDSTDTDTSSAVESRPETTPPETEPASESESETAPSYADIGDGHFSLDKDTYYVVAGREIPLSGSYDFDAPTPKLTATADKEGAITVDADGRVYAAAAGDYTLTVREETYGTTATAALHIVGDITDNIIISVPVWRGKWVTEEQFGYMKEAGVDMVVAVSGVETANWRVSDRMLTTALSTWSDGRGLFIMPHSTNALMANVLSADDKSLQKIVDRFADSPAFAGYHIIDEPYDCSPYAIVQRRLGILDPLALTDVNFLPGGAYASMEEYRLRMDDYCKLLGTEANAYLSLDNYPFGPTPGSVDENALFGNFEATWRAGLENRVRTAFYVQAVGGFNNSYRRPDRSQLTYHTASALAYGFKWIKYWSWFVPDYGTDPENTTYNDYTDAIIGKDGLPTDLYPVAQELHGRVHAIGSLLVDCEAVEVYHTGRRSTASVYTKLPDSFFAQPSGNEYAILSLLEHGETGRQYLMVVNKNISAAADFSFRLEGVDTLVCIDTYTGLGETLTLTDHTLTLSLEAGDFALYELPEGDFRTAREPSANLAQSEDLKVIANVSQSNSGWFIDCALDGLRTSENRAAQGWRVPAGQVGEMTFLFDKAVELNRIDLYPCGEAESVGASFPISVKVSYATAEAPDEWITLYENTAYPHPTTEVPVLRFDTVTALKVKLEISSGDLACELAEIELYCDDGSIPAPAPTSYRKPTSERGINYALNKTPIASGSAYESQVDRWGLAYLTDGSKLATEAGETNGWMAQGAPTDTPAYGTVWGGVDLGAAYTINDIKLYPRQNGNFFPIAYDVQISTDGVNWETVAAVDNDPETRGVVRDFPLTEDRQARFVRVVARKLTGGYHANEGGWLMQLSEIEVYWN